jgi:HlyD family secretion protein
MPSGAALLILIVSGLRTRPVEVEVGVVTTGPLTVTVLEEGKTRIRHRYLVSPPVSGYLRRVELRAGRADQERRDDPRCDRGGKRQPA